MPARHIGLVAASVVRVVDGDTLIVSLPPQVRQTVRLIGIDTPERRTNTKLRKDASRADESAETIQRLGARASDFTKRHLHGRTIELEWDAGRNDRYGRALVYVWLDHVLYNAVLVRDGYANLMTIPPNLKYSALFTACYREARELRRGLWGSE